MNEKKENKFNRWQRLKDLGFNYNFSTVSDKFLKQKLEELKNTKTSRNYIR